jgi:RHS repeat-associated protein
MSQEDDEGLSNEQKKEQNPATQPDKDLVDKKLEEAAEAVQRASQSERDSKITEFAGLVLERERLEHPEKEEITSPEDPRLVGLKDLIVGELARFKVSIDADEEAGLFGTLQATTTAVEYLIIDQGTNAQQGADPVSLFNGEFAYEVEDIRINGAGIDFVFKRTYRNQVSFNGRLGFKWDHSFNLWLHVTPNGTIYRTDGALRQETYIKHPKFDELSDQGPFNYYVPQDGQHGIILKNGNESFIWRSPNGDRYIYNRDPTNDFLFRIVRIQDKNGDNLTDNDHSNYLEFEYSQDNNNISLLQLVRVNHQQRKIQFSYDEQNRIKAIEDYVGRSWNYHYDDFGDLIAVTTPKTDRYPSGLTTCYEYSSSKFASPVLQHNLTKIFDPAGQMYLENEYGSAAGILNFNRIIRQRQGNGESYFEYENVIQEFDHDYRDIERPVHQTNVVERNDHIVHYIYNEFGNLLLKEEEILLNGRRRLIRWRYRYNADGALIAILTPDGSVTQYYYGRDRYLREKQITDEQVRTHDQLMQQARMTFGNLLAVVKRGVRYNFTGMHLETGVWGNFFDDIIDDKNFKEGVLLDIITKFAYESDYQQMANSSDARYTESADPNDSGSPRYRETLTNYEYRGTPGNSTNLLLSNIKYPDVHRPDGHTLTNVIQKYTEYDNKGRLKESIDQEGIVTRFDYFPVVTNPNDPNMLKEGYLKKKTIDPNGLSIITEYEVNDVGIVNAIIHPRAVGASSGYFRTTFDINSLNQVTRTVTSPPFSYKMRSYYNRNGLLERVERDIKDENGDPLLGGVEVKTYQYDEQNNLLEESIGDSDPANIHLTIRHKYNKSHKRVVTVLPKGNQINRAYDERLFEVSVTRGSCSLGASTIRTAYDRDGLRIESIDGSGNVTRYKYDPFGRLIETSDPLGNVSCINYDKAGYAIVQRFFEKESDGTYLLLRRSEYEYDELNRQIFERKNLFSDPPSTNDPQTGFLRSPGPGILLETQFLYDKKKRLEQVVDRNGHSTFYKFDNMDRKIRETDALGNYTQIEYDKNGNVIREDVHELVTNTDGGITVLREDVFSTLHEYDELDRFSSTTDSLGNITTFFYDSRNNLVKQIDALKNVKRFDYDIFGRKVAELYEMTDTGLGGGINKQPIKTEFEYDKNGNIISYIDANLNRIQQEFDELDRRVIIRHSDSTTQEFRYDSNDNIVIDKDNNGLRRLYRYDSLNHMLRMDLDPSGLAAGLTVELKPSFEEFQYNGFGDVRLGQNDFATTKRKTDSLGRAYQEILTFTTPIALDPLTIHREFDAMGSLTQITYPSGRVVSYNLDFINRIKRIDNIKKGGSNYRGSTTFPENYEILHNEYRGLRRSKTILGNGASTAFEYDGNGRIIEIFHTASDGDSLRIQQLYDDSGNMRFKNDITRAGNDGESYKYNSFYWLTKLKDQPINSFNPSDFEPSSIVLPPTMLNGQQKIDDVIKAATGPFDDDPIGFTYKYDQMGNRKQDRQLQEPHTYKSNNLNEYTKVDQDVLNYDLNGNLVYNGHWQYIYDYRNQLSRVYDPSSGQYLAQFFYDFKGRRILSLTGGQAIHVIFDEENVLEEYRNGSIWAQYVNEYALDTLCQIAVQGHEYWYHKDIVQSSRLLTSEIGTISERYHYLPFGIFHEEISGLYNPYTFTGRRFDITINAYDFRTRSYSPSLGRFLQRDSIPSSNLYMYVQNNPLIAIDPLGNERKSVSLGDQNSIKPDFERHKLQDPLVSEEITAYTPAERILKAPNLSNDEKAVLLRDLEYERRFHVPTTVFDIHSELSKHGGDAGTAIIAKTFASAASFQAQDEVIAGAFGTLGELLGPVTRVARLGSAGRWFLNRIGRAFVGGNEAVAERAFQTAAAHLGFVPEEREVLFYWLEGKVTPAGVSNISRQLKLGDTFAETWGGAYMNALANYGLKIPRQIWLRASGLFAQEVLSVGARTSFLRSPAKIVPDSIWLEAEKPVLKLGNVPIQVHLRVFE